MGDALLKNRSAVTGIGGGGEDAEPRGVTGQGKRTETDKLQMTSAGLYQEGPGAARKDPSVVELASGKEINQ